MTSRHHYSIPGASLLKTRVSSKTQAQKPAANSTPAPNAARDPRQSSSSRAHHTQAQDAANRQPQASRPPSVNGYRQQVPMSAPAHSGSFPSAATPRPPPTPVSAPAQRSSTVPHPYGHTPPTPQPQASSSKTRLDVPDSRGYFSKMFGRKASPIPRSGDEKQHMSGKTAPPRHQRSTSAQVLPTSTAFGNASYPQTSSLPNWGTQDAMLRARGDSDRDERARLKARDDRIRAKDEKARAEYAAYKARVEAELAQGQTQAPQAQAPRAERRNSRAVREERKGPEYESDSARRRQQAQQSAPAGGMAPVSSAQYTSTGYQYPATNLAQHVTPAPHDLAVRHGVPIQPSASSHSTNASQQPQHGPNTAAAPTPEIGATTGVTATPNLDDGQAQKRSQALSDVEQAPQLQNPLGPPQRSSTPPTATKMLPAYAPNAGDDKTRLMREAAQRDAYLVREQLARERERDREREKELEADRERARKEEKRMRRAERERQKELERAERARLEELERAERERQRELERREKERMKAAERAERERVKETERIERERAREKERERERQYKAATRQRTHRSDKAQSTPVPLTSGITSGSDGERLYRQGARHRPQSATVAPEANAIVNQAENSSPESRRDLAPPPSVGISGPAAALGSISRKDVVPSMAMESPAALPIPPPLNERHDILYPRSMSAVPTVSQGQQQHTPPGMPGRVRTDSFLLAEAQTRNPLAGRPDPLAAAAQSRLVSIYAAQGPPDRTPDFFAHKLDPGTPARDQSATPGGALPSNFGATVGHRTRTTSQDRTGHRQSMAIPSGVALNPAPAPAARPQSRVNPLHHAPSLASLRQFMSASHGPMPTSSATLQTPTETRARVDEHAARGLAPSGMSLAPPQAQGQMQQASSTDSQRPGYGRSTPAVPPGHGPQATGFSSYSQSITVQTSLVPPGQASRVPSNNSASHSPKREGNMALPSDHPYLAVPVSRNPSDSSNSTETGAHYHHVQQLHTMQTPQGGMQPQYLASPMPTSAMYSQTANHSSASRTSHDPPMNSFQNSAYASHAPNHAQTSNHATPTPHPHAATTIENNLPRSNNAYNTHTNDHIPSFAAVPTPQNRYPHTQQNHTRPSPQHNASANVHLLAQSQLQAQAQIMHNQEYATPTASASASLSTSQPYNSAVAPANPPASHRQSVLLPSQSVHPPASSLYHNHSSSRNDGSIHQRLQAANNVTKPSPPGQSNAQLSRNPARSSAYITSVQQTGLHSGETPTPPGHGANLDAATNDSPQARQTEASTPIAAQQTQTRPASIIVPTSTSARPTGQARPSSRDAPRAQDKDVPPPLTPSNSSRESHEEILMTPSSLDVSRTQPVTIQRSDSQRSEKKRSGIFGLFRSNTRTAKASKIMSDQRAAEGRRSTSGPAESPAEIIGGTRLSRISSAPAETAASSAAKTQTAPPQVAANSVNRQSRSSRPVPPPIAIPPQSIPYRLFTSKSKQYRTMSSASMEALDGTANNTVVGSPTSSRHSTTTGPGPMTPPARDPVRATVDWRNNEERAVAGRGKQRRRRPGVTFDGVDDDNTKNGAHYRAKRRMEREMQRYGLDSAMMASEGSS